MPHWDHRIPLFVERTILAEVASRGEAVFEPCVAGIFRSHARQGYRQIQEANPSARREQWLLMARQLDALVGQRDTDWQQRLQSTLLEASESHRREWELESRTWPADIGLCWAMRAALFATTPPPPRQRIPLSPSGLARAGARAARSLLAKVLA
jgi:hypothetical protein